MKKPKIQKNNVITSIESNLLLTINSKSKKGKKMNIPPIVGVCFLLKCCWETSSLIFCKRLNFLSIFKPYFVITIEIKKNDRNIFIICKFLKRKEFIINENRIKKNKEEKFSDLVFPIIF